MTIPSRFYFIKTDFEMVSLKELQERHSTRNYADKPLTAEQIRALKAEITLINTHNPGLDFTLVTGDGSPFNGASSYGNFKGVSNYIVAVGELSFADVPERAGYYGEQLVMIAQQMGLASCFASGTYSQKEVKVNLRAGQKILFVIAIGYAAEKAQTAMSKISSTFMHLKKKSHKDFYTETDEWPYAKALEAFPMLEAGLQAVACAPSGYNKRPVRISIATLPEDKRFGDRNVGIVASVADVNEMTLFDLGIAKYNFGAVCPGIWDWGNNAFFFPE